MAGDWDTHPSDITMDELIKAYRGDLRPRHEHVHWAVPLDDREQIADQYEVDLVTQPRFVQIPGGLKIGDPRTETVTLEWDCGCRTSAENTVLGRCLQHYRDALYYRNRIKAARHAAATGTLWPTPMRDN